LKTIGPPANAKSRSGISEHQPAAGCAALAEHEWQRAIVRAADELGLTRVGFAPARPFHEAGQRLADYVRESRHASMAYLARSETRSEPRALLAEVKTVIAVALSYAGGNQLVPLRRGRSSELPASVASYALGPDYHHVLKLKLLKLADACADIMGRRVLARSCVSTRGRRVHRKVVDEHHSGSG
jgi:epoxyqueuosine reductase QueG